MARVEVYGADWCGDTQRAIEQLRRLNVEYEYIDVEQDKEASDWVKQQNDGKEQKPTIRVGSRVLSVPDEVELEDALRREHLISKRK